MVKSDKIFHSVSMTVRSHESPRSTTICPPFYCLMHLAAQGILCTFLYNDLPWAFFNSPPESAESGVRNWKNASGVWKSYIYGLQRSNGWKHQVGWISCILHIRISDIPKHYQAIACTALVLVLAWRLAANRAMEKYLTPVRDDSPAICGMWLQSKKEKEKTLGVRWLRPLRLRGLQDLVFSSRMLNSTLRTHAGD